MNVEGAIKMMAVYFFGYSIGVVSGILAYRWWLLGEPKRRLRRSRKLKKSTKERVK